MRRRRDLLENLFSAAAGLLRIHTLPLQDRGQHARPRDIDLSSQERFDRERIAVDVRNVGHDIWNERHRPRRNRDRGIDVQMPKPFAAESISPISQMRFVFAQAANHRAGRHHHETRRGGAVVEKLAGRVAAEKARIRRHVTECLSGACHDFQSDGLIRRDRNLLFVSSAKNDALIGIAV